MSENCWFHLRTTSFMSSYIYPLISKCRRHIHNKCVSCLYILWLLLVMRTAPASSTETHSCSLVLCSRGSTWFRLGGSVRFLLDIMRPGARPTNKKNRRPNLVCMICFVSNLCQGDHKQAALIYSSKSVIRIYVLLFMYWNLLEFIEIYVLTCSGYIGLDTVATWHQKTVLQKKRLATLWLHWILGSGE